MQKVTFCFNNCERLVNELNDCLAEFNISVLLDIELKKQIILRLLNKQFL